MKRFQAGLNAVVPILAAALLLPAQQKSRKPGLYAVFDTSMGTFVCELYEKRAPLAVENFLGLAQGTKE